MTRRVLPTARQAVPDDRFVLALVIPSYAKRKSWCKKKTRKIPGRRIRGGALDAPHPKFRTDPKVIVGQGLGLAAVGRCEILKQREQPLPYGAAVSDVRIPRGTSRAPSPTHTPQITSKNTRPLGRVFYYVFSHREAGVFEQFGGFLVVADA